MGYTIGKRERTSFLDDRGRSVDGYRVWYTMEDGTTDYIEIEKAQYNIKNVRAMIEEEVAVHDEFIE